MKEEVILVDLYDNAIGKMEKLEAHKQGVLHRAFSVFIFNSKKELLIQQRALTKYHSAALWTNTCCSHPRPGESIYDAAKRRLMEEMGMETELEYKSHFIYKTKFNNDLTEHEFDHVFVGASDLKPEINKVEVNAYKYLSLDEIKNEIKNKPEEFTSWFKIAIEKLF
ncbi:isopentenyl-diphosphate Delta-isomerase [Aurantibacillus circumpalustris]|uniref:isopentenyl-diphosphate Delta-isomerase n=1 Tax=Aurantibacillus circumpalustris TaxID=3036359 RepID=UPI00295A91AA|nr:isopentenyl-diphosphate Delta-isomerase [Aurantibacillus circumpalustris]